jgi:hypothetical protein
VTLRWAAAAAAAGAIALAGCGGDDEKDKAGTSDTATTEQTASTETAGTETESPATETEPAATGQDDGGTKAPGEDGPGGAGDEVPNATPALITGRGGKLGPATVSVPPFIAITVELRSADGLDYALRGGGKALSAGEGENSDTATFDGLRPGRKLVLSGPQGRVTVTANAEPGP